MKLLLPAIGLLISIIACDVMNAQVIKAKMTDVQVKELEKRPTITSYTDKPGSVEKQRGKEQSQLLMTYFYKAILHRSDKTKYPADNNNAMEKRMIGIVAGMPSKLYEKASRHVQATIVDKTKKENKLGKYADVVFAGKPLAEQLRVRGGEWQVSEVQVPKIKDTRPVNFLLNAMQCVDESNPESGNDDIVAGGLFSGPGNTFTSGHSLFCGRFDDGDYFTYSDYQLGGVEYSWKENFPQTYYAMLVLVEVDHTENESGEVLDGIMEILASLTTQNNNQSVSLALMQSIVEGFLPVFFDEDMFQPFGIKVELKGANDLYINDSKVVLNNGVTEVWSTPNIIGQGGRYKMKLKFRK